MFAWSRYRFDVSSETAGVQPDRRRRRWQGRRRCGLVGTRAGRDSGCTCRAASLSTTHRRRRSSAATSSSGSSRSTDRRKGTPLSIDVKMDSDSILANTLVLFGGMIVLVAITFVAFIWFIRSRGSDSEVRSEKAEECDGCPSALTRLSNDPRRAPRGPRRSVRRALVTSKAPKPVASDRASIRSTLLLTTPSSVTRPLRTIDVDRRVDHAMRTARTTSCRRWRARFGTAARRRTSRRAAPRCRSRSRRRRPRTAPAARDRPACRASSPSRVSVTRPSSTAGRDAVEDRVLRVAIDLVGDLLEHRPSRTGICADATEGTTNRPMARSRVDMVAFMKGDLSVTATAKCVPANVSCTADAGGCPASNDDLGLAIDDSLTIRGLGIAPLDWRLGHWRSRNPANCDW